MLFCVDLFLFYLVVYSDEVNDKRIINKLTLEGKLCLSQVVSTCLHLLNTAVASYLGGKQDKLRYVRDVSVASRDLLTVAIEDVPVRLLVHTEIMPAVLGVLEIVLDSSVLSALCGITAHDVTRGGLSLMEALKYIRLHSAPLRLKACTDKRRRYTLY